MRPALLTIAVLSLVAGLWSAWSHFRGDLTRDQLMVRFGVSTVVWFVCATTWAYTKPKGA